MKSPLYFCYSEQLLAPNVLKTGGKFKILVHGKNYVLLTSGNGILRVGEKQLVEAAEWQQCHCEPVMCGKTIDGCNEYGFLVWHTNTDAILAQPAGKGCWDLWLVDPESVEKDATRL